MNRNCTAGWITCALTTALTSVVSAGVGEVIIDGAFDDWDGVPVTHTDPSGDGGPSMDFGRLWVADDDQFLFVRLELGSSISFNDGNLMRLYIDADMNASTGLAVGGIGAELVWRPGDRAGVFLPDGGGASGIGQHDIQFRSGPTVTTDVIEFALGRDAVPDGVNPLFLNDTIRLYIVDEDSGDTLPDTGGSVTYTFGDSMTPNPAPRSLDRRHPGHLRVVTHNVLSNGLFDVAIEDSFQRLYTAVAPDILNLQELYNIDPIATRDRIATWLGGTWHVAAVADCTTVSRYPILGAWAVDGNLVALIDTTSATGRPTLMVNAHLPCCTNNFGRQNEADAIVAFIRDAFGAGGPVTIDPDTSVVITGDLNLVGFAQQLETLLNGDIQDEAEYGKDAFIDPDGSPCTNVISRQTEKRMGYTWRNDSSSFWPGHLDYIIYSDSNVKLRHDFIMYTPEMSPGVRDAYGLEADDSTVSDHLILCADFSAPCVADLNGDNVVSIVDLIAVLSAWGPCDCDADIDQSGDVGIGDLLIVLAAWGDCV